jgi:hypothetical protein
MGAGVKWGEGAMVVVVQGRLPAMEAVAAPTVVVEPTSRCCSRGGFEPMMLLVMLLLVLSVLSVLGAMLVMLVLLVLLILLILLVLH